MKKTKSIFLVAILLMGGSQLFAQGLKDVYKKYFMVGVAVNQRNVSNAQQQDLLRQEFNSITAENDMKPEPTEPNEGEFSWERADRIANFCRQNGIKLRGHCLMWHTQLGKWMLEDNPTKEVFYARMKNHIQNVVTRYKDIVYCWDVVNEAITDDKNAEDPYRQSPMYKLCGDEFIARAFQYAREADPKALLFYNDYNETDPVKSQRIYEMVKKMKDNGVPIDGIGMQGHYNIYGPTEEEVDRALNLYKKIVKHIHVTELDVRINEEMGGQLRFSRKEIKVSDSIKQHLADQYARLFRVFRKHKDVIDCVTFWNLSDRDSWLGVANYPLSFDSEYQPKMAYKYIHDMKKPAWAMPAKPAKKERPTRQPRYQSSGHQRNPIVQTCFTTDPAPLVVGDSILYVYTGHDEDNADFFWMQEWRVYSTKDMVNWTDHGSPLALESFSWADDRAWAAQTIERDGKFYWYICAHSKLSNGMAIGVAVSDSPTGPFRDAIGKPLFENGSWDHIDPTVMIDDDGQAWLMWGNPRVYYLKLNRDMISYEGELGMLEMTEQAFGSPTMKEREKGKEYKDSYVEGPWIRKVDISRFQVPDSKKYQLLYAAGGVPEHISYSTAPSPTGPWTYAGIIMPLGGTESFTNHCGVTDFKGHSYFFYHTGKLPGGGGFGRSTAVEEFRYNPDGSFPTIHPTDEGVQPIGTLNPYTRVEAETMAFSRGLKTEQNRQIGVYVTDIHNGDYIRLDAVDFSAGTPKTFTARVASGLRGGQIEVRIDSIGGPLLTRLEVPATGGWEQWKTLSADIEGAVTPAVHDLFFVFTGRKGPKLFNFDWWGFNLKKQRIIEDGGTGPHKAVMLEVEGLKAHTIFAPQDLSKFNQKNPLPVLVWGNGACANSPFEHAKFLNEIASYGYLVIATGYIPMNDDWYNGPMSTSQQQIESIDWAYAQNADPASPYYQKIDLKNLCLSGMSCGGLQSLYNCAEPRVSAMMICNSGLFKPQNAAQAVGGMPMPDKTKLQDIHTPIIYILGGKPDIAYENGMDDFHRIQHVPAYAANLPVGHGGTYLQAHGGEFAVVARAWLDWQLKGDSQAARQFTGKNPALASRQGWTLERNKKAK